MVSVAMAEPWPCCYAPAHARHGCSVHVDDRGGHGRQRTDAASRRADTASSFAVGIFSFSFETRGGIARAIVRHV